MTIYYLLPLLGIVLVVVLAKFGQKLMLKNVHNMSPEQARAKAHEFYKDSFDLQPGETLFATWVGEDGAHRAHFDRSRPHRTRVQRAG